MIFRLTMVPVKWEDEEAEAGDTLLNAVAAVGVGVLGPQGHMWSMRPLQ